MHTIGNKNPFGIDLSAIPIFENLPSALLGIISHDMMRSYRDSDVVFTQGSDAKELLVLLHGQVRILADGIFLVARKPYDILGEQALIEKTQRSATGIAQGSVQVLALPDSIVNQLMAEPIFLNNLLRLVSNKLSQATNERAFRYRTEELLFSEFRSHVSVSVLNKLMSEGVDYGKPRFIDAIVLFSDIRSFTNLSAQMESNQIAAQLSPYLDTVVDIVHKHEGMVDKFIGDAVMAIWGYSPTEKDMVAQALECAKEMVSVASSMKFADQPILIGVGLNAGSVFIGNVGGVGKRQFTVLGSVVNLAARYESASKELESPIVMGSAFYERLDSEEQSRMHPHPNHQIKGAPSQTLYTCDVNIAERK